MGGGVGEGAIVDDGVSRSDTKAPIADGILAPETRALASASVSTPRVVDKEGVLASGAPAREAAREAEAPRVEASGAFCLAAASAAAAS